MRPGMPYRDRIEAGEVLAEHVLKETAGTDAVVLALPRGGVPVGLEVARALDAPLEVFVVRKLGVPGQEELAMGAIAAGGFTLLNERLVASLGVTPGQIAEVTTREEEELRRREALYRGHRPTRSVHGRVAILVDDGLATGFTMRAAVAAVRELGPKRLIVAVPVGAPDTCEELAREVDRVICPLQPEPFQAVGLWYHDFAPTTDDEVRDCLAAAATRGPWRRRQDDDEHAGAA